MPQLPPYPNFKKSDLILSAIDKGKLWRAKEILQGRIRGFPYDPGHYEAFGRLLLEMGDTLEAGRFLFASGARHPAYEEAIALFLSRHSRNSWASLIGEMPGRMRVEKFEQLPESVRAKFLEIGLPPQAGKAKSLAAACVKPFSKVNQWLLACGCGVAGLFIILAVTRGAVAAVRDIASLISRLVQ